MQKSLEQSHNDQQWHAILHASQTLLDAAKEESWSDLTEQASLRDRLIRDYFSKPITVENAIRVRDKITQLLAMDEQVLGLARKEQANTMPALKKLSVGKKAIKAYQNTIASVRN